MVKLTKEIMLALIRKNGKSDMVKKTVIGHKL